MPKSEQVRLLLIEDVPQVAQYIRGLLATQATIKLLDTVSDGSKATQIVQEQRPDVIILDALLQGHIRGMQLIRNLQALETGIPIIVLTVPQHPVRPDPELGIYDVVQMPFTAYDLITRILGARDARARGSAAAHRVVAIFAPKGGVGRTTLAFNIAAAAVQMGIRVCLVDGSIQFSDVRQLLRVPQDAPSVLDLPTDHVSQDDLLDVLWKDPSGVEILLGPPRVEMAEMVFPKDLVRVVTAIKSAFDLVIIDTAVTLDEVTLALLDTADLILQVLTYDGTTLRNTAQIAETFRTIGYPADKVHYILNRSDAAGGVDPDEVHRVIGREPEHNVRSDGLAVVGANNQGRPLVVSDPEAPVSRDIAAIARELVSPTSRPVAASR